jgi:beta-galactosidase
METQPGCVNWAATNNMLRKGEARAMAWHAVAHGADAVLYWQWRSALGGQEQYHGTLVDQSGQPRPFYEEVCQLGRDFASAAGLLSDSTPVPHVALLNDYSSRWSTQWQPHHQNWSYVAHFRHYYRPLAARNIQVDIVSADAPLEGYKLVIAPALLMVDESRAARLQEFVRLGGCLVLTIRCGMKDGANALLPARQPGLLAELAGAEVEEYYALLDPIPVQGNWFAGTSQTWAERLHVLQADTQVLARYGSANGWLDGQAAVTVHPYGQGFVYMVGAYLDEAAQQALVDQIVSSAGVKPVLERPTGVEACKRISTQGNEVLILINHERTEMQVWLPWPAQEHLSERAVMSELQLPPYGVAVLTRRADEGSTR